MRILSPMSEADEADAQDYQRKIGDEADNEEGDYVRRGDKWSKKVEHALVRLSTEVAALREQITTGREWKLRRQRSLRARLGWFFWIVAKHFAIDLFILGVILLWMRRRKDRRFEDQFRAMLRLGREYVRKILPSR